MSRDGTIHVVGAGLSGLAAAVHLSLAGRKVALYEAGAQAGGRCRSYFDKELGCRIDNGNHLLLSCNEAALSYLDILGTKGSLMGPSQPIFPFMDMKTGERWKLHLSEGKMPWWIFNKKRRVPGTKWSDYFGFEKLIGVDRWKKVGEVLNPNTILYRRFWEPMTVAILNTQAHEASAKLFVKVLEEAFDKGGAGCRPLTVREGLSESFIDPALKYIETRGATVQFGQRLRALTMDEEVRSLSFADKEIPLGKWDWVVLALPPWVINDLLPRVPTPTEYRAIVNAHFRFDVPKEPMFTGLIGGNAEWVFAKEGVVSTTTSAAEKIVDQSAEELAALLWRDVARLYGADPAKIPPNRIVKEKRATFACTPDQVIRRPPIQARNGNMVICGDWTDTKLPATIEGAIRAGRGAAHCILSPTETKL